MNDEGKARARHHSGFMDFAQEAIDAESVNWDLFLN
jgi:hypothetical protein